MNISNICTGQCYEGQGFAQNNNPLYAGQGLKGHTGVDVSFGYGSPIASPFDMYIHEVVGVSDAGPSGYTSITGLVENDIECFDYQIGHCDPTAPLGFVKKGDILGTEGNHGPVYAGNRQISLVEQKNGNHEGSHQHHQKRPLKRLDTPPHYLNKGYSFTILVRGVYYEVWDYFNGYNGCIDPVNSVFQRSLAVGMSGYDVACLQRILKVSATGFYWTETFAAVRKYQIANGLSGVGMVGPLTRQLLSNIA